MNCIGYNLCNSLCENKLSPLILFYDLILNLNVGDVAWLLSIYVRSLIECIQVKIEYHLNEFERIQVKFEYHLNEFERIQVKFEYHLNVVDFIQVKVEYHLNVVEDLWRSGMNLMCLMTSLERIYREN